jgi:tetratricopeptide (TPR) repeat protein
MTYVYQPQTRAATALNQKKPQQAIQGLQPAADYDFAAGFALITERADAYRMAGQPEKAAIEYRKILDHAGVDPVSALFPLAWLGLARAESQMGHIEQSRADYEKLFGLWSQADADLPLLVAARREYKGIIESHPLATKR